MLIRSGFRAALALAFLLSASSAFSTAGIRISVVEGDPGQVNYQQLVDQGYRVDVFLDGVKQRYTLTADEGEGVVVRFSASSATGEIRTTPDGRFIEETVRGKVEIRTWRDPAAASQPVDI
ncbi:hypothetical protein ABLE91_15305 [Aquabacter sp. CN5-332]|uniref:hypothetical protein n=1 Tax=Aquabacter sp. CN5-332 TaxID=3156608 RepID=UPI0032B3E36F